MLARFPYPLPSSRRLMRPVILATLVAALLLPVAVANVSAATTCQRVFTGNASGARDVTSSLTSFLRNGGGRRLCLRANGVYRVNGTIRLTNVRYLYLDGRNATLRAYSNAPASQQREQIRIENGRTVSIKNLKIRGTNPNWRRWNSSREGEDAIGIYGGRNIGLSNIRVRDVYGDGIYIGYDSTPSASITMTRINIARVGRSGVAIVGGNHITITSATITSTGMHSVNLEPNEAAGNIHAILVQRSYFASYGLSDVWNGYAFNAWATSGDMSDIRVLSNRAPTFHASVLAPGGGTYTRLTFSGNRSTTYAQAIFENVVSLTFANNTRISKRIE